MSSSQQRCLVASVLIHGALLSLLLFAPAFTQEQPSLPVLTMAPTDIRLTDGDKVGGGNPNAQPPATSPKVQEKPALPAPVEPKPAEPDPEPKPKPVKVAEKTVKTVPVVREPVHPKSENPSQDTDPVHPKPPKRTIKTSSEIKVADAKKRDTKADEEERKAAEDAAEREAAAKLRRARASQVAQLNEQQKRLANTLAGAAQAVGKHTSGSTAIEMPGPGGQAYAPYGSYLGAYYKERWRKPSALSVRSASIVVELVIARDGRVVDSKFEKSGYRELDDSVAELIRNNQKLRPLPDGTTDAQRTFRIKFTLEADSTL